VYSGLTAREEVRESGGSITAVHGEGVRWECEDCVFECWLVDTACAIVTDNSLGLHVREYNQIAIQIRQRSSALHRDGDRVQ
jgi:hypothetical protein